MEPKIAHWWPGRQFKKESPIPSYLIKEAQKKGTRYLTVVTLEWGGQEFMGGVASCCPKDSPDKELGRTIAIGRLWAQIDRSNLLPF